VPSLKGKTVQDARTAWTAAGFTGSFTPAHGQDTKIVKSQNPNPGACLPATTGIVVTAA
jgi:beta-lactam-binding protein with PASTA domain